MSILYFLGTLPVLVFCLEVFIKNQSYRRWLQIGLSIIALGFLFSFFSIGLTLLISGLKYFSKRVMLRSNFCVFLIVLSTLIYHLFVSFPDLWLMIFNKNLSLGLPKYPELIFIFFKYYLLDNKKIEEGDFSNCLWQFVFFPVFFIPFYIDSSLKKKVFFDFFKSQLYFLSIFIFTKAVFSESFSYWKEIAFNSSTSSYNFIQALFVYINNFIFVFSEIIATIALLNMILISFSYSSISFSFWNKLCFEVKKMPLFYRLFLYFTFSVLCNNILVFPVFLILSEINSLSSKNKLYGVGRIMLISMLCFLIVSPDVLFLERILIGLLNIKTILIYYNEFFILWPLKMSLVTPILFILFYFYTKRIIRIEACAVKYSYAFLLLVVGGVFLNHPEHIFKFLF